MMKKQLEQKTSLRPRLRVGALTLLRVVVGVIMITHGWMKLTDVQGTTQSFASMGIPMPELSTYLAIAGELAGGIGILLGMLTPIAALGVFSTMVVAIGWVHLPNGLLAQQGGFEYPLTLAAVSLYLMVRGAGPLSIDAWWAKRSSPRDVHLPGQHPSSVHA